MQDGKSNAENTEITAGGITAGAQTEGFVSEEGAYTAPSTSTQVPPQDEGIENTKQDSDDNDLFKFFGKEAVETLGIDVEQKPEEIKENDIEKEGKEIPESQIPPQQGTPQTPETPVTYTQEQVDSLLAERLAEEVQKFQHINTFFEEYQKDPYSYMAKHSPHLFEKFDEIQYVKEKLTNEFGEFTPDPNRVYQIGTTDYAFRIRQDQLLQEAQSLKNQAYTTVQSQQEAQIQEENSYKAAKAQELGMDVTAFESKIWNQLKSMDKVKALDAVIDGIIYKQKLDEKSANIRAQIDLSKAPPSPSNVTGTGRTMEGDKELAMIKRMFADGFE